MSRTRVRWGRAGALALSLATAVSVLGARAGSATGAIRPEGHRAYVVRSGDTLWRIARDRVGASGDPRPYVDQLIRLNHLGRSPIVAGQRLALPG